MQEAVQKLNEAKVALQQVRVSVAEAEAAQAAAEALRPWPSDARLVPSDYPLYPPSTPQRLHPDVASVGSFFFSLSSPTAAEGPSSPVADGPSTENASFAAQPAHHAAQLSSLAADHRLGVAAGSNALGNAATADGSNSETGDDIDSSCEVDDDMDVASHSDLDSDSADDSMQQEGH